MKGETLNKTSVSESNQDEAIYPLAIGLDSDEERTQIVGANGWHIAYVEFSPTKEIAQRIVTAVNSHDLLVKELEYMTKEDQKRRVIIDATLGALQDSIATLYSDEWDERDELTITNIKAAIAKATQINQ